MSKSLHSNTNEEKVKWSNWHITINMNEGRVTHEKTQRLADFIERIVRPEFLFQWVKYRASSGSKRDMTSMQRKRVLNVRARVGLEQGDVNNCLHAHIILEIAHTTMIQIDYNQLNNLARKYLNKTSNIKGRFVSGDASGMDWLLHYISKTVPGLFQRDIQ